MERKKRDFLKVRKEGGSNVLTVGKAIPDNWKLVEIAVIGRKDKRKVILEIVKVA